MTMEVEFFRSSITIPAPGVGTFRPQKRTDPPQTPGIRSTANIPPVPTSRVRVYLDNVEITALLKAATWSHGQQIPNRVGGVARSAVGQIVCWDNLGYFSAWGPHSRLNLEPGAEVRVENRAGDRLFTGWSGGVQSSLTENNAFIATIPLYGPLRRFSEYREGFIGRASAPILTASEVFDLAVREAGGSDTFVYPSTLQLLGNRVNAAGLLAANKNQRVNLLTTLQLLASVDGAYIYDDRLGRIVFEGGEHRPPTDLRRIELSNIGSLRNYQELPKDYLVVNVIDTQGAGTVSLGENPLQLETLGGDTLPLTFIIPPSVGETPSQVVIMRLTRGDALESIRQPVNGRDFTGGVDVRIDVEVVGDDVHLRFYNFGVANENVILNQVIGEPVNRLWNYQVYSRNSESIQQHGPRQASYPLDLLVEPQDAQARADDWVKRYGEPALAMNVIYRLSRDADCPVLDISSPVRFSLAGPSMILRAANETLTLDATQYTFDSEGDLDIQVTLRQESRHEVEFYRDSLTARSIEFYRDSVEAAVVEVEFYRDSVSAAAPVETEFYRDSVEAAPPVESEFYRDSVVAAPIEVEFYRDSVLPAVVETEFYRDSVVAAPIEVEFYRDRVEVPVVEVEFYRDSVEASTAGPRRGETEFYRDSIP